MGHSKNARILGTKCDQGEGAGFTMYGIFYLLSFVERTSRTLTKKMGGPHHHGNSAEMYQNQVIMNALTHTRDFGNS